MDSFLGAWQGVAIVGIVVGILGSLVGANLKARIDLLLSSVSHRWATRTDVRRKQRAERIELLIDSLKEQMHAQMDKLKSLILSVGLLVGGLGFFYRWKPRERRLWWTIFLVCAYSNGTRNCSVWAT